MELGRGLEGASGTEAPTLIPFGPHAIAAVDELSNKKEMTP